MLSRRSGDEMPQEMVDNQEYGDETVITDGQIDVIDGSYISVNHVGHFYSLNQTFPDGYTYY